MGWVSISCSEGPPYQFWTKSKQSSKWFKNWDDWFTDFNVWRITLQGCSVWIYFLDSIYLEVSNYKLYKIQISLENNSNHRSREMANDITLMQSCVNTCINMDITYNPMSIIAKVIHKKIYIFLVFSFFFR